MEPGGSMPHSQGLSNNPYPELNQPIHSLISISSRSILILSSHLRLGVPKGLFPVGLPVKILKALPLSSILATCPAHRNLLDLINLTIGLLGEPCVFHKPRNYLSPELVLYSLCSIDKLSFLLLSSFSFLL